MDLISRDFWSTIFKRLTQYLRRWLLHPRFGSVIRRLVVAGSVLSHWHFHRLLNLSKLEAPICLWFRLLNTSWSEIGGKASVLVGRHLDVRKRQQIQRGSRSQVLEVFSQDMVLELGTWNICKNSKLCPIAFGLTRFSYDSCVVAKYHRHPPEDIIVVAIQGFGDAFIDFGNVNLAFAECSCQLRVQKFGSNIQCWWLTLLLHLVEKFQRLRESIYLFSNHAGIM